MDVNYFVIHTSPRDVSKVCESQLNLPSSRIIQNFANYTRSVVVISVRYDLKCDAKPREGVCNVAIRMSERARVCTGCL